MSEIEVLVLPISGGGFANQLGITHALSKNGFDTPLMFGASGGNVAAYLTHAANFDPDLIRSIASELKPSMFCTPWFSAVTLYSYYHGYTKEGSIYNSGEDNAAFFEKHFNERVGEREIWTAAYNTTEQKTQLFCNRKEEDSILGAFKINSEIYQVGSNVYANEDLPLISSIVSASAAIPGLVPPQIINGHEYQDGGLACASPMTAINSVIDEYNKVHIIFVNCENPYDIKERKCKEGFLSEVSAARDIILRNIVSNDRLRCYELLSRTCSTCACGAPKVYKETGYFDADAWDRIKLLRSSKIRTFVELYPLKPVVLDITKFKGSEVVDVIDGSEGNIGFNIWYI